MKPALILLAVVALLADAAPLSAADPTVGVEAPTPATGAAEGTLVVTLSGSLPVNF